MLTEYGETPLEAVERYVRLEAQEAPRPGPTDVLLRIRACAVGWVDLLMSSGQYQHMAAPPYTPGLELAGDVVEVGSQVTRVAVGDRVLADGFLTGPRSSGPYQQYGGFATWALLPEAAALRIPAQLGFREAVNLLGNYETAYHVLVHRGRLQAGETVLVNGASGSTGLAAVQVAKILGATVIATGRSEAKLAEVQALGADHVIAVGADDGGIRPFRDEVKALSGGGVHVVYDGVGGPISVESIRAMRFGGRFCIVGWAATPFVAKGKGGRGAPNANQLPTNLIQMKGLDVLGCPAVIATLHDPALRPRRLAWIFDQVEQGHIRPHVGPVFPLDAVHDALRAKWRSDFTGGCVIEP
ncbi:MAG: NADPH:quinone oxidoreductase family protein [Alphaproteobacteria bacterium]|nr:NADPH:quinone oxidoreductase family protein [Alphaproteobacteria bacterium]